MKMIPFLIGFFMLAAGFIFYITFYWNTDFFGSVGEGIVLGPQLVPLGIVLIGFMFLIYGLSPKEKSNSVSTLEKIERERIDRENHLEESKKNHINNNEKSI